MRLVVVDWSLRQDATLEQRRKNIIERGRSIMCDGARPLLRIATEKADSGIPQLLHHMHKSGYLDSQ